MCQDYGIECDQNGEISSEEMSELQSLAKKYDVTSLAVNNSPQTFVGVSLYQDLLCVKS